jgi:hypothetical protein
MELTIKEVMQRRTTKPHFKLKLTWMHGDADSYDSVVDKFLVNDIKGISDMKRIMNAFECCRNLYIETGKGGYAGYEELPEYLAFFEECPDGYGLSEEEHDRLNPNRTYVEPPADITGMGCVPQFDSMEIVYIDSTGDKHEVDVEWDPAEIKRFLEVRRKR